ncbi:MAG: phosphoglycerate dehydrogenase [Vicinamibacterales bacterium]
MSRIVVAARSFAKNPTLRMELLARYGDATFNESGRVLSGDALIALLRGHDRAIVGLEPIDDSVLIAVPELRVISKYGVGLDAVDLRAIARHGVRLAWTGGVNRRSVAELTLMFAVALLHRVPQSERELREGRWAPLVGRQLTGRTVGIVGCGHVGKDLVELLEPFGCRVLANDIRDYAEFYDVNDVQPVSLLQLLHESQVVTLHVPLDATTRGMMGRREIAQMQKGAILINAARGGLVDEIALKDALLNGHLAGAACDVFNQEPPVDQSLLELPTFLGTPHIGGSTEEAQLAMGRAAIEGLETARLVDDSWSQ